MNIQALKEVAERATPGPWTSEYCYVYGGDDRTIYDEGGHTPDDALHIATFNPQTVLAMIRVIEAVPDAIEELQESGFTLAQDKLERALKALEDL